jgi:pyruvate formate lyase activating enzyme
MTHDTPSNTTGWITDIERFSTRDGPGIRTTVFFKGCPLRCMWCSNPETWSPSADLYFRAARCQSCARCMHACAPQALDLRSDSRVNRAVCTHCMRCVDVCPQAAWASIGREVTPEEVLREVLRDLPFYHGEGGVTLSGGEPLAQPDFLTSLLCALAKEKLSVVLDTSGVGPIELVESILPTLALVLLDIKHMDSTRHREGTGMGNEAILEIARTIAAAGKLRISLPLVPGFNDDDTNISATGDFARSLGVEWIDLMPLHRMGADKYRYLGMQAPYRQFEQPSQGHTEEIVRTLCSMGLRVTVGRLM